MNLIKFQDWGKLKNEININAGISSFSKDDIDKVCTYYDENLKFFDWVYDREFVETEPSFVLLPKRFFEYHNNQITSIPEMIYVPFEPNQNPNPNKPKSFFSSIKLRDEQIPILDHILNIFNTPSASVNGIISAAPGVGKTIISIDLLHNIQTALQKPTLIIVPNQILEDQWINSILNSTSLEKDDISIIQGSDLNKLKEVVATGNITVVKIQSLYSQLKNIDPRLMYQLYSVYGLILYDECHGSGAADGYAKTSSIFKTDNIIGLSATPYRNGLNDYLLRVGIGDILYKSEHKNLIPDVEIYNLNIEFTPSELRRLQSCRTDYIMFLAIYNSILATKQEYFDYISDWVSYNESIGHSVVILFSTNKMVDKLIETIKSRHTRFELGTNTNTKVLQLIGDTKKDSISFVKRFRKKMMSDFSEFKNQMDIEVKSKNIRRKDASEKIKERRLQIDAELSTMEENAITLLESAIKDAKVIISNYNLLSAGFDKPALSNILYGSPRVGKISVIQSIGRITRIHPNKNKPLAQFFFTKTFTSMQKTSSFILQKNIQVEYNSEFKFFGFQENAI